MQKDRKNIEIFKYFGAVRCMRFRQVVRVTVWIHHIFAVSSNTMRFILIFLNIKRLSRLARDESFKRFASNRMCVHQASGTLFKNPVHLVLMASPRMDVFKLTCMKCWSLDLAELIAACYCDACELRPRPKRAVPKTSGARACILSVSMNHGCSICH